jgi:capsular exopolysaccharide synthesis family protein
MELSEEYIDLRQYGRILRRRWIPAALVSGGVLALTAAVTFLMKPVYEAEALLLITENGMLSKSLGSDAMGVLDALSQKSDLLNTEAEIIKAEPLLRRTINEMGLKQDNGEPLELDDFLKKLNISNTKDTDILSLTYQSTDPRLAAAVVNKHIDVYRAKNLQMNRSTAAAARKFIESQVPKAENELSLLERQLRRFQEKSKVVSVEDEASEAIKSISKVQENLTLTQGKLADAASRVRSLRGQLGFTGSEGLDANALSQSPAVQKALTELQTVNQSLATARAQYGEEHPVVLELKDKQTELDVFLRGQVKSVIGAPLNDPSLETIQAGETQQKLTEELVSTEVQRLGLQQQINTLNQAQENYRDKVSLLPRLGQLEREITRKLKVSQETYAALMKSLQEFRISENQNIGNVDIVAPATVPEESLYPKILLNLAIGTVLGVLLGIGTALLLEALDNTVKTVKEAQDIFDLTVLGNIPLAEGAERVNRKNLERTTPKLVVRDEPRSAISESFRTLQANLKFLSSDNPPRVIVMTSAVPQEGKSTTTANLALAIAEMGHRVLIIDADLRRPSQHQIWELPNNTGLTHVLVESGSWSDVIRSENEHLDIMTAGLIPPNPLRLLDSNRMVSLIKSWREVYDYVIFDTPPLAVASDALLLTQIADGLLMVTRLGVITTPTAELAKESLAKLSLESNGHGTSRGNVLGLVVNGVIPENEPDSYYYYAQEYYSSDTETLNENGNGNGKPPSSHGKDRIKLDKARSAEKNGLPKV